MIDQYKFVKDRITLLSRVLHSFPERFEPVMDAGIVFYTYYPNHCSGSNKYLQQAEYNAKVLKEMDPDVSLLAMDDFNHF